MAKSENSKRFVLISTTQRCGSSWLASICSKVAGGPYAEYVSGLNQQMMNLDRLDEDCSERIAAFSAAVRNRILMLGANVFKTHDVPPRFFTEFLRQNENFHVVNVIRDFRDVLISRLMYNRYHLPSQSRPYESEFVAEHQDLSDQQLARQFYGTQEMLDWFAMWRVFKEPVLHERYICFTYEKLLQPDNLKSAIRLLGEKLVGGLTDKRIEKIATETQFDSIELNKNRDRKERESKSDFCRKGVSGDFLRFLTPRQSQTLKLLMI